LQRQQFNPERPYFVAKPGGAIVMGTCDITRDGANVPASNGALTTAAFCEYSFLPTQLNKSALQNNLNNLQKPAFLVCEVCYRSYHLTCAERGSEAEGRRKLKAGCCGRKSCADAMG
jgi:hypothetical protein